MRRQGKVKAALPTVKKIPMPIVKATAAKLVPKAWKAKHAAKAVDVATVAAVAVAASVVRVLKACSPKAKDRRSRPWLLPKKAKPQPGSKVKKATSHAMATPTTASRVKSAPATAMAVTVVRAATVLPAMSSPKTAWWSCPQPQRPLQHRW